MTAEARTNALGIQRRMTELGRIRLGDKGSKGQPQKLTKFRLTSASRPLLEAAARMYGGTVRAWQNAPDDGFWELYTETDALDVMVPPVINAYSQLYEIWDAGGCLLRCDGSWESIAEEPCSHDHEQGTTPDGKPWVVTTRVSVILPKLPGLGTWRLETKGWNAAATLPGSLDLLLSARNWVPAILRLEQRSSKKKVPGANGQLRSQTFRYVVPVLDIIGFTFEELMRSGVDAPALPKPIVEQQRAIGPSRPPRGTKVHRPALGPAPALPAVSDFRKPTAPKEPAAAPSTNGGPVEPPELAGGWVVEGEAAPQATESPQEAEVAPTSTPPENGAAAAAGVEEGSVGTVTELTQEALFAQLDAAGIHREYAAEVAKAMWPDRPARTALTPAQRDQLLHALLDDQAATAAL